MVWLVPCIGSLGIQLSFGLLSFQINELAFFFSFFLSVHECQRIILMTFYLDTFLLNYFPSSKYCIGLGDVFEHFAAYDIKLISHFFTGVYSNA